jgi:hypothetical protein
MWVQWHAAILVRSSMYEAHLRHRLTSYLYICRDWGRWSSPESSPIFDGSETSIGSQGEKVQHNSNGMKPAGNGGGCIAKGPFKDMKVNLGYVL